MTMNKEKVLDKIKKLLALSESNYEGEAQAALLKAQELMFKYGFAKEDLEVEPELKIVVDETVYAASRMNWWKHSIAQIIADNFRCYYYYKIKQGIHFVGLKIDVEIAASVFNYCIHAADKLASQNAARFARFSVVDYKKQWLGGFIKGLRAKFEEQVKCMALVLVKSTEVNKKFNSMKIAHRKNNITRGNLEHGAHELGFASGKSLNVHNGILKG